MANANSFGLLTEFVQRRDILDSKRAVLLAALCILVYNNTQQNDKSGGLYLVEVSTDRFLTLGAVRWILSAALWIVDKLPFVKSPNLDHATAAAAIQFLSENHWLFDEIEDVYIDDYVKTVVYPLIGLLPSP